MYPTPTFWGTETPIAVERGVREGIEQLVSMLHEINTDANSALIQLRGSVPAEHSLLGKAINNEPSIKELLDRAISLAREIKWQTEDIRTVIR